MSCSDVTKDSNHLGETPAGWMNKTSIRFNLELTQLI